VGANGQVHFRRCGHDVSGPLALSANGLRVAASQFPSSNHANNTYVAVRVFQYHPTQNEWQAVGSGAFAEFVPPYLGNSVSISGDGTLVAVGSGLGQLMSDGNDYVYEVTNTTWIPIGFDVYGTTVALSSNGKVLLVPDWEFSVYNIIL
jgi:hypothetical protein